MPPALCFVSVPKPQAGTAAVHQLNAVRSWRLAWPGADVLLVGDDAGVAGLARDTGALHVPDLDRNEFGTPLLSSAFHSTFRHTDHPLVCFLNCDIVLADGFPDTVAAAAGRFREFLVVGRRTEVDLPSLVAFTEGWRERLAALASSDGWPAPSSSNDYFVFTRGVYAGEPVPPFAMGRSTHDNWLIWSAARRGVPVIDASASILALHQSHGYGHVAGLDSIQGQEGRRNRRLCPRVVLREGRTTLAGHMATGAGGRVRIVRRRVRPEPAARIPATFDRRSLLWLGSSFGALSETDLQTWLDLVGRGWALGEIWRLVSRHLWGVPDELAVAVRVRAAGRPETRLVSGAASARPAVELRTGLRPFAGLVAGEWDLSDLLADGRATVAAGSLEGLPDPQWFKRAGCMAPVVFRPPGAAVPAP